MCLFVCVRVCVYKTVQLLVHVYVYTCISSAYFLCDNDAQYPSNTVYGKKTFPFNETEQNGTGRLMKRNRTERAV